MGSTQSNISANAETASSSQLLGNNGLFSREMHLQRDEILKRHSQHEIRVEKVTEL